MSTVFRSDPRARARRIRKNRLFLALCIAATSLSIVALGVLLTAIGVSGYQRIRGIDHEARDEARQPHAPEMFLRLDEVQWAALATTLERPALAALDDVRFSTIASRQDMEYADEITDADWTDVATQAPGIDVAALGALTDDDWYTALDTARVDGDGWLRATWENSGFGNFVTAAPSRKPARAGIGPALAGTMWICAVCALFALPIGVGTAVFLEEYKPKRRVIQRLHGFVQLNISNLAGVPSIVYGIIGLSAFVEMFGFFGSPADPWFAIGSKESWYHLQVPYGRGVFAGGLTLMLVILPIVIISSQEALRAVPDSLRQGSLALGGTRWQTIRRMTLPTAIPGIMTGAILAMSRAIGEAAPVLIICGIVFIRFTPQHLMDEFTALPLQIYDWAGRPQEAFHAIAASGIIVLLGLLLTFNAAAIVIRQKFQKQLS